MMRRLSAGKGVHQPGQDKWWIQQSRCGEQVPIAIMFKT
jgi:hypothetical protein